jgi:DNA-binding CsgD family transcriptional regulator
MSMKLITYTGLLNDIYYFPKETDNRHVLQLLRQAEAIPQNLLPFRGHTHVVDYTQRRHVGLGEQIKNSTGYDPRDIMNDGLDFVISIFQKDDFKIYNETIFSRIVEFLKNTPHEQHGDYLFSFTYRFKDSDGKWRHLFQQGNYITDSKTCLPIYGLGLSVDISPLKKDNSMIFTIDRRKKDSGMHLFDNISTDYYYPDPKESRLSKREREVLGWLAEGYSSKQIAGKLYLSENTVIIHRKNMLKKTNTKNIAELIRYAIKHGLI